MTPRAWTWRSCSPPTGCGSRPHPASRRISATRSRRPRQASTVSPAAPPGSSATASSPRRILEMEAGYLFVSAIDQGATLVVHAARGCDMGLVGYEMTMLASRGRARADARTAHGGRRGDRRIRARTGASCPCTPSPAAAPGRATTTSRSSRSSPRPPRTTPPTTSSPSTAPSSTSPARPSPSSRWPRASACRSASRGCWSATSPRPDTSSVHAPGYADGPPPQVLARLLDGLTCPLSSSPSRSSSRAASASARRRWSARSPRSRRCSPRRP